MATYTPQTRIDGASLGSADAWYAWARDNGAARLPDVRQYLDTIYAWAPKLNLKAHALVTQSIHETSNGTVGWVSYWWKQRCNPAGIGITGYGPDDEKSRVFANGREAALAHIVHVYLYVKGKDLPAGLRPDMDPRWDAAAGNAQIVGRKKTLGSFGSDGSVTTWAVDPQYGTKWAGWLNRLADVFAGIETPPVGGNEGRPDVATYKTSIPGLPGGPLETSFPINVDLIATWRTNNRPGLKLRGTFETCQHATANSSSTAKQEANYLRNGAEGRYASWHATMDEVGCEITLPLDEVGYHASDGAGPGNYGTVACELTQRTALVNNPTLWRRARRNAAEFMGKVAARKGSPPPGKFHRDYAPDKKWCPAIVLNNATWVAEYHTDYRYFYDMEKAAMAGGTPTPEQPNVIEIGDTLRTLVSLNMRQSAGLAAPIIATLPVGAEVVVSGRWESADGYGWLPVTTAQGEGVVAQGDASGPWLEWVKSAPAPDPKPEYVAAKPIPALLETDLKKYDTAEGITTDAREQDFVFVADVIEFTTETIAAEYAVKEPRPVRAPYQAGERAIAAWLVKSQDTGSWWYVLTGGDNEWVRVPYANTKRISDAPLLGDDMHAHGDETEAA